MALKANVEALLNVCPRVCACDHVLASYNFSQHSFIVVCLSLYSEYDVVWLCPSISYVLSGVFGILEGSPPPTRCKIHSSYFTRVCSVNVTFDHEIVSFSLSNFSSRVQDARPLNTPRMYCFYVSDNNDDNKCLKCVVGLGDAECSYVLVFYFQLVLCNM